MHSGPFCTYSTQVKTVLRQRRLKFLSVVGPVSFSAFTGRALGMNKPTKDCTITEGR